MKTITEFPISLIQKTIALKSDLTAQGKSDEEMQAAMTEALKLEGDKLQALRDAVDLAQPKIQGLKRVIVSTLLENEKAPSGAQQRGNFYFTLEFFPAAAPKGGHSVHSDRDSKGRGGRDGKGKKGKGGRREGGRDGNREGGRGNGESRGFQPRRPQGEGRGPAVVSAENLAHATPGGESKGRPEHSRRPGGARPPRKPQAPRSTEPHVAVITPKVPPSKPAISSAAPAPVATEAKDTSNESTSS